MVPSTVGQDHVTGPRTGDVLRCRNRRAPAPPGPAPAHDSCTHREPQPSAIDTDYKQRLPRVNTAAGSSAQPLLPEMPLLKHKDHRS